MTPNPAGAVDAPITRLFAFGYKSRPPLTSIVGRNQALDSVLKTIL
jgi:hypothetical protein